MGRLDLSNSSFLYMKPSMINYSFIIPHHNTPDLLQRLVDSIPQRDDIEIIVVDDNSDYDKKANISRPGVRTIYIDKLQTKGAGHARNVGMDNSSGKWLLFADADDFYKPNFIEVLDEYKDDDIEILFFNIESVDSVTLKPINRGKVLQKYIDQYGGAEDYENALRYFVFFPWCKMINHAFVKLYNFRFEEISVLNDSFFALQTGHFAKKIKVDKRKIYTWTFRLGSIANSKVTKRKYTDVINVYRRRQEAFNYIGHPEWNLRSVKGRYSQSIFRYIFRMSRKHSVSSGVCALFYYLTHKAEIERGAYYYVDILKELGSK